MGRAFRESSGLLGNRERCLLLPESGLLGGNQLGGAMGNVGVINFNPPMSVTLGGARGNKGVIQVDFNPLTSVTWGRTNFIFES